MHGTNPAQPVHRYTSAAAVFPRRDRKRLNWSGRFLTSRARIVLHARDRVYVYTCRIPATAAIIDIYSLYRCAKVFFRQPSRVFVEGYVCVCVCVFVLRGVSTRGLYRRARFRDGSMGIGAVRGEESAGVAGGVYYRRE